MKILRDKFNHWRNLLPHMRFEDAASKLQAHIKGYLLRKDFNRFNRMTELLYKLVRKKVDKDYVGPAFKKWKKNARLIKCDEDARIIQDFCRKILHKTLKGKAQTNMQKFFKRFVFKMITEVIKTKVINPEDIDNLYRTVKRVAIKEPFYKLLRKLRWKMIINQLKNIPKIYDRCRKDVLRKYLEKWYTNAIIIPDEMANKIQNAYRSFLSRRKLEKIQKLYYILEKLVIKNSKNDDEKKLATLMKWRKNARLIKCDEDARIIQKFCRSIHHKAIEFISHKWQNLARRIMPNRINKTAKFNNLNVLINKLIKKKFFDNLLDTVNKRTRYEIIEYLIKKNDKNSQRNLLRKILREWLDRAKRLRDLEEDAATYIQSIYRGYLTRKDLNKNRRIEEILSKIILKLIYHSDSILPSAFKKWKKNARLLKCHEDSRIIQKFCRETLDKIKRMKEEENLK